MPIRNTKQTLAWGLAAGLSIALAAGAGAGIDPNSGIDFVRITHPGNAPWMGDGTPGDRAIDFRQELAHPPTGYAYRYHKRVAIDGDRTFVIERTYPASPARVFSAFADPALKFQWFGAPAEWNRDEQTMDFRIGGREVSRGGPKGGQVHTFDARYYDTNVKGGCVLVGKKTCDAKAVVTLSRSF